MPKGSYRPVFQTFGERVSAAAESLPPKTVRNSRIWIDAGAAVLMAIAAGVVYWWPHGPSANAVLPLENLSADPEQEYFSEGMTDAVITNLAKIRALRVISRTSVLRFRRTKAPISEIAKQLGVDHVVEGTVTRAGDRVRVTAQLIAVLNERHLWAESFERSVRDILGLQSEISQAIASQVNVHVTPQERIRLTPRQVSPEAHDLYLKARFNWYTRDPERLQRGIDYYDQAIRIEPGYALAYVGMADSLNVLSGQSDDPVRVNELLERAHRAAQKAVELDNSLGEAYVSLVMTENTWEWQRVERELRKGLELSSRYRGPNANFVRVGANSRGDFKAHGF